jgi:hypothetical protein
VATVGSQDIVSHLLIGGVNYEPVVSESVYEAVYERLILRNAGALYPGYVATQFKCPVVSDMGTGLADLALIENEYRGWWVVEVELAHHPFEGHVLPQVERLSRGRYGDVHAEYLSDRNSSLDLSRLIDLMKGVQPRVLVVINALDPRWEAPLASLAVRVQIVELFRSQWNRYSFRVTGSLPLPPPELISVCRVNDSFPRTLIVESPAALKIGLRDSISIWFEGGTTEWQRVDASNRVWLVPKGRFPFTGGLLSLHLVRESEGRFAFIPATRLGGKKS